MPKTLFWADTRSEIVVRKSGRRRNWSSGEGVGSGIPATALLLEDGTALLLEDGTYLLLES